MHAMCPTSVFMQYVFQLCLDPTYYAFLFSTHTSVLSISYMNVHILVECLYISGVFISYSYVSILLVCLYLAGMSVSY